MLSLAKLLMTKNPFFIFMPQCGLCGQSSLCARTHIQVLSLWRQGKGESARLSRALAFGYRQQQSQSWRSLAILLDLLLCSSFSIYMQGSVCVWTWEVSQS